MSLYIFDKDGTLVATKMTWLRISQPVLRPEDQILKAGVFEKMAELRKQGHVITIASNQSAVYKGLITLPEAEALMRNCAEKVGGVNAWRICPFSQHARRTIGGKPNPYRKETDCQKPKPGMLIELMQTFAYPVDDTFMIGNSWRDRRAAQAAGICFYPAKEFFKPKEPER